MATADSLPPVGDFHADPHRVAAAYSPATAAAYDDDAEGWMVWRHHDVAALLRDPSFKKDPAVARDGPYTQALTAGDFSMLFMDGSDHRRLRGLVAQAFSKRATEAFRAPVERIADDLLDALEPTSGPVDIVSAFAVPLPVATIADILGVDRSDRADFKRWSDDVALSFDPGLSAEVAERVAASGEELRTYSAQAIRARRASMSDDLIGALVAAQDADGSRLSDNEAVSAIALLLFGGNATTTDLIASGILALLQNPDQLAALQADPALIANAVEEMLRFDPPVVIGDRIPSADVEIGGCPVSSGEWVWPVLSSANRDPDVFDDPQSFNIRRESNAHTSFGGGAHFCLGAPLARMETQIAIGSLVARFPNMKLADPSAPLSYKYIPGFRGLRELFVTLD